VFFVVTCVLRFSVTLYSCVRSDGHGAKKWQSADAGIQSHALKAMAAFVGCLSNEMLKLPPVKVNVNLP
jgi:hypothetical protein